MKINWLSILKMFKSPYERYQPTPTMPEINFQKKVKRERVSKIDDNDLPTNVERKQGQTKVRTEKKTEIEFGIEVEMWSQKDAELKDAELKAIQKTYPSINQDAVIVMKREWSKDRKLSDIEFELKKRKLKYGQTYIKYCLSVFNEYRQKIGELSGQ